MKDFFLEINCRGSILWYSWSKFYNLYFDLFAWNPSRMDLFILSYRILFLFLLDNIPWLWIFNLNCDITTTSILKIFTVPKFKLCFLRNLYFNLVTIVSEFICMKRVFHKSIWKMFLMKFRFCNINCESSFILRSFINVNWNIYF